MLPKLANCSLLQLRNCVNFQIPTTVHRGARHANQILFASLVASAFYRSIQLPESQDSANYYPNPSPLTQAPVIFSDTSGGSSVSFQVLTMLSFSNVMNVLLFKTYFAWKDLHVLTTGLSDFTSIICPLKSQAQLVKELQCRHSAGGSEICYLVLRQ